MNHVTHVALVIFFAVALGVCVFGFLVVLAALITGKHQESPWDDEDDG